MNAFTRIVLTLVALLAGGSALGVPALAQAPKKVTLRLAFIYNGHRSPYLLGAQKGFYAAEGLDLTVLEGTGVSAALQLVASGQDTFAVVDPPSLMLGVAQGMPLRQIVQLYQSSPNALIYWKDAGIKTPKDMEGKTVTTITGDTTTTMLMALIRRNNVDQGKVKIFATDGGTRMQAFLGKRAEGIVGFSNDSYMTLKAQVKDVDLFLFSDYGIDTMGDGVAANVATIEKQPDVVRGFVKATLRAYQYAFEHPEESIDALMKVAPTRNRAVELEKIKATRKLTESADTAKLGMGYSAKAKWQEAEDLMAQFGGLAKRAASVESYYTNEFLPKR
jgi:NitT/TauT family transport system substrate-binding protein